MARGVVAALGEELGGSKVLAAAQVGAALATVDFRGVRDRSPAALVRPATFDDVRRALAVLADHGEPVSVIGGGHGPRSVQDGSVCLDLRSIPRRATFDGELVHINGSALVADVLAADPAGRAVVPVGVSPTVGIGLLTTGGIGALARAFGLSIDSIRSVDLLLADATTLTVTERSPPELWWAVRGAATRLGVVTGASFATHSAPRVWETRVLTRATVLPAWAEAAPALPREVTLSWVMSPADDGGPPVVLLDEVALDPDAAGTATALLGEGPLLRTVASSHPYRDFCDFAVPVNELCASAKPADTRVCRTSPLLSAPGMLRVLPDLVRHVRDAPTPWCRVEAQQMGGAVADVGRYETPFHGRAAEYSLTAEAVWQAGSRSADRSEAWVAEVERMVAPATIALYMSEITPNQPALASRLDQGYGPGLARLWALARAIDPDGRFRFAPPFTPETGRT